MTIKKNHIYALTYKGKYVANYSWREPLNKEQWVLVEDEYYCPLSDQLLKQLLNDSEVTIIDLGSF